MTGAVAAPQVVLDAAATTTDEPCTDEMEINGLDSVCDDDDEELVFAAEEDAVAHDPQNNVNSLNADSESTAPVALSKSADEVGGDESFVKVELDEESDFNWHVLQPGEILEFTKDEAALARMRKSGWQLDSQQFPPEQRYPGL